MTGIRTLSFSVLLIGAGWPTAGTEVDVQFTLIDSVRTETLSFSTGDTARATLRHTGYLEGNLTFDPVSQRPTAIRFIGGNIRVPASSLTNTADIRFDGIGIKHVVSVQSSSDLDVRTVTIGSVHPISYDGWVLETERIRTYPFVGTLTMKLTIDGRTQTQTIDVATNPPDNFEPSSGTAIRLQVFETRDNGSMSNYKITFRATVNERHSELLPKTDTTITGTSRGTTYAEGAFIAPNKFGQWLLDQGYEPIDQHSLDSRGIPLAVLYALDLLPDRGQGLPWSFASEQGSMVLSLQLPDSGIRRAIQIESCADLLAGNWEALSEDDFLEGDWSLAQGASGNRRIRFPGTKSRFYRIVPGSLSN